MGAQHDMRLAKKHLAELYPYKIVIADKGYQGLAKTGLQTPKKRSIVKHLKNRNGVAPPYRTICTVYGGAPCYTFYLFNYMPAVFPKPPILFQPGKTALYYPSFRQYRKTVQFISFDNLYLRTN